jgi:hypothetical protein
MDIVKFEVLIAVKSKMGWNYAICCYSIVNLKECILLNISEVMTAQPFYDRGPPIILGWFAVPQVEK